ALHQLRAVVVREPGGGNGLEEMYMDGSGADDERPLRHHLTRPVDERRYDVCLRRDREDERALLERTKMIVLSPSPLGADDHRPAALHVLGGDLVRLERRLAVVAIDEDDPRRLRRAAEQGQLPELLL